MNLDVLKYLVKNAPERIEDLAEEMDLKPDAAMGISRQLIGDDGDISKLTQNQTLYFEKVIQPLIENVRCYGMIGDFEDGNSSCNGSDYIDDDELISCYEIDEFYCQHCRYAQEKMRSKD